MRAALGYLESEAAFVRRGHGGAQFEHAGGLIAAAYRHRMSRALDPQLHTHVVTANLARGAGRPLHGASSPVAIPGGADRRLPLSVTPARRGSRPARTGMGAGRQGSGRARGPAVGGAARVLPAPRAGRGGRRGARGRAGRTLTRAERSTWGAIATRDRKQYGIDTHTWREEVAARAAEHGLDRATVEALTGQGQTRRAQGRLAGEGQLERDGRTVSENELAEQLTGPSGLTERANTFDEASVLREYAAAAAQGARVDTLRGHAGRFAAREDVLGTERGTLDQRRAGRARERADRGRDRPGRGGDGGARRGMAAATCSPTAGASSRASSATRS